MTDSPAAPSSGRTLVVDPTFGVAGDMLVAALLDAGADQAFVRRCVEAVLPDTVELRVGRTVRRGMAAATFEVVLLRADQPHRAWSEVRACIERANDLPEGVRSRALTVFTELAEAEAAVHGVDPEDVHFHEVGAWDSISDVVGVAAAMHSLGIERVETLPVSVGSGTVRAAHGLMPVPVPAVLELLTRSGLPWQATPPGAEHMIGHHAHADQPEHGHEHQHGHSHVHQHSHGQGDLARVGEMATPTGVAVLAALAVPAALGIGRSSLASGVGAGHKDFSGWPNVVRVTVTTLAGVTPEAVTEPPRSASLPVEALTVLEANLDDVDPRVWPSVIDNLLAAGARDAWLTPSAGKKGRTGHVVSVLVDPRTHDPRVFVELLMTSTGTLGVREHDVRRHTLERGWARVALQEPQDEHTTEPHASREARLSGDVRVKYGHVDGCIVHVTPEYEDCASVARRCGVPVLHVLDSARAAADAAGLRPGTQVPE